MNILCRLGLHRHKVDVLFVPSISARVVTDYVVIDHCQRCGRTLGRRHSRWDGHDFVPVEQEASQP
jgi:hypothetical protein